MSEMAETAYMVFGTLGGGGMALGGILLCHWIKDRFY